MSYPMHPDDMPSPRFGGWADDFNTYEEACAYYGAESPAMLAQEAAHDLAEWRIECQDDIEIRGPQFGAFGYVPALLDDEIPF